MILGLLILAMVFRWSTIATKTGDYTIVKYQKDNWSNSIYVENMNTMYRSYSKQLVKYPDWGILSPNLTQFWCAVTGANIIWFVIALTPKKRDSANKERGY